MAKKMAELPSLPMQLAKRVLYQGMDADFASQLQFEALVVGTCAMREDHLEALKAFLEKESPSLRRSERVYG